MPCRFWHLLHPGLKAKCLDENPGFEDRNQGFLQIFLEINLLNSVAKVENPAQKNVPEQIHDSDFG